MQNALAEAGGLPNNFTVDRIGPYEDGSYEWQVILPKGSNFNGETFWVVDYGGGAVRLLGSNSFAGSVLKVPGTQKLGGKFYLKLTSSGDEVTRALNHNATDDEMKSALEELSQIT